MKFARKSVFSSLPNKGNIKVSTLLILLNVLLWVILVNMKFSQEGCFQIRGRFEYAIPFFSTSHLQCFSQDYCQNVYEDTILFQLKFQKFISSCSTLQKIRMSTFVVLKWRPFEYKVKSWKICPFSGLFFSEIKNADVLNFSWNKYFGHEFSFLIK